MADIVSNAYMKALLKTTYLSGVANNKSQNSTLISQIKKDVFTGKEMKYAMQYGNGGNFGSNFAAITTDSDVGARNGEWTMGLGYLSGFFDIDQPEILQSDTDKAAYMKIIANKMSACFDGLSKTMAIYLYGSEYGVIDTIQADITVPANGTATIPVTSAGSMKLDIGSRIVFASAGADNTAMPDSPLAGSGTYVTVTSLDDSSITVKNASSNALSLYIGDYIELYGSRTTDATGNVLPTGIQGLADFLPTYADRDSSDSRWTNYIGTAFRGIKRDVATNRLAGQFVKAATGGTHDKTDAVLKLLKKTKRQGGGFNNICVINDEDFEKVNSEAQLVANFQTQIPGTGKARKVYNQGLSDFQVAFGDATSGDVIIDPFCTEGNVYSLDKSDLSFFDLADAGRVISPVANDQLGKYDIESVGDQGIGNEPKAGINIDKMFSVTPADVGVYGPSMRIGVHLFGNYSLRKTSSSGVAKF